MSASRRPRGAARAALIAAARAEFDEVGFEGTDSNRIARRAGYAPQTFYWHFADKAAIFVELFRHFVEAEYAVMRQAIPQGPEAVAAAVLRHHVDNRLFRRSLRLLSLTDPTVRTVRVALRRRQISELCASIPELSVARAAALLLSIDRLADAEAEGELIELGVTEPVALLTSMWELLSGRSGLDTSPLERMISALPPDG